MTNEMIIFNERIRLFDEGIIKGTGRMAEYVDEEGEIHEIEEPEEIHSFAYWKEHEGRIPRKGSKAITSFPIWCMKKKKDKEEEECNEDDKENQKMFLKTTFFFTKEQTEVIRV